jgi:2-iminobutanoate/2-iminopropanoate deaminase
VIVGDLVVLAGHMPKESDGSIVAGGFAAQAHKTFDNLGRSLTAAGCGFEDVIKVTTYLADLANFDEYNEIYRGYFGPPYPARTTVEAGMRGFLIEIEGLAVRARGRGPRS